MLIKCPECGAEVPDYTKFCVNCGFKLDGNKSKEINIDEEGKCPRCGNNSLSSDGHMIFCSNCNYVRLSCPKCGSFNIIRYWVGRKGIKGILFGVRDREKTRCCDCGYEW